MQDSRDVGAGAVIGFIIGVGLCMGLASMSGMRRDAASVPRLEAEIRGLRGTIEADAQLRAQQAERVSQLIEENRMWWDHYQACMARLNQCNGIEVTP